MSAPTTAEIASATLGFYAYPGEQYRVEGEKNGFYRIYFQGKYRWISKQYTEAAQ